jgi:hypothetical protein
VGGCAAVDRCHRRIPAGKKFDKVSVSTLPIRDPGHGLRPEIGAIHVQVARPPGGGIGLDLIARLCERRVTLLVSKPSQGHHSAR